MKTKYINVHEISEKNNKQVAFLFSIIFLISSLIKLDLSHFILFLSFFLVGLFKCSLLTIFSFLWLNLGLILGNATSRLTLFFLFFIVILPIGLIRKLLGHDELKLKDFHKNKKSSFINRHEWITHEHFNRPF